MRIPLLWRLLGAMLAASLLPLALVFVFILVPVERDLEAAAHRELESNLRATVEKIGAYLELQVAVLETTSRLPGIIDPDPRVQAPLLQAVATAHDTFTLVKRIGRDGVDSARSDGEELQNVADRDYFRSVIAGSSTAFQTLVSKTTGQPTLTIAVPVKGQDGTVGVLSGSVGLAVVSKYVNEVRIGKSGFAWLVDAEKKAMAFPDAEVVRARESMAAHPAVLAALRHSGGVFAFDWSDKRWYGAHQQLPQGWTLFVQIEEEEALALARRFQRLTRFIGLVCLIATGLLAVFLARAISRPVVLVSSLAERVAAGDLTVEQSAIVRNDEIGTLSSTFDTMTSNIRETLVKIGRAKTKLESVSDTVGTRSGTVIEGVTEQRAILDDASLAVEGLNTGIQKIVIDLDALTSSSEETSSSILEMAASMEEVTQHTGTLFSSVEETASATAEMVSSITQVDANVDYLKEFVNETSASMVEMSATIGQVERSAARSAEMSTSVSETASSGMVAVRETREGMERIRRSVSDANAAVKQLGQRSHEIGRVVDVIAEIASQTNLLALNASILAAQAGEHGAGFSVVAIEIRDLAERTANSTKEIGALIRAVQTEVDKVLGSMAGEARSVDEGVRLAGDAETALQRILESAGKSLEMGREIAGATTEMARGSEMVTTAVGRVQDLVGQVNAATRQQATGAEQILKSIEQIREVARLVRQAISEQKDASGTISRAAARVIDMVREISGVTFEQANESEKIVTTMAQIRAIAESNRASAREMQSTITLLADAIRQLDGEMRRFKVSGG